MTTEQSESIKHIIEKTTISKEEWMNIYSIYNDTFNTEINYCEGCTGQNQNVLSKLTKLYNSNLE